MSVCLRRSHGRVVDGVTGEEENLLRCSRSRARRDTNERPAVNPPIHHRAGGRLNGPQPTRDNAASESIHLTAESHLSSKPLKPPLVVVH